MTIDDHYKLSDILDKTNQEFHTYKLPSEKTLRIILRCISIQVFTEEVKAELIDQGFDQIAVSHMYRKHEQGCKIMILVELL